MVIAGGFFMFLASMGIGANDVANAFATSIGSGALTMKSAIVIACIFELLGAVLMGSHVTETIRKDIANYECFVDSPEQLMYGCVYVLLSVGLWLFIASKFEMPVSTTHSCVGGMIGMAIALGGTECVNWFTRKDSFPYVGGVGGIILSWLFSPLLSLLLSLIIFGITRQVILRSKNSFRRSFISFPIFVGLTLTINSFFVIYKGGKNVGTSNMESWVAVLISIGIGLFGGLLTIPVIPKLRKYVLNKFKDKDIELEEIKKQDTQIRKKSTPTLSPLSVPSVRTMSSISFTMSSPPIPFKHQTSIVTSNPSAISSPPTSLSTPPPTPPSTPPPTPPPTSPLKQKSNHITTILNYNINTDTNNNDIVQNIHENAEKFLPKTEESFKFLQIFTAICDSFSHGANDIANSVGPFATIYSIWLSGQVSEKSVLGSNSYWILGLGGSGIGIGLLIYGYKIIRTIGVKLCKITPSRGFAIELGSAIIILMGSRLGIPLSTTHCQVGATMGIGLLEKKKTKKYVQCAGLNLKILLKTMIGWILTLLVVGGTSALFVAQGIYSPSIKLTNLTNIYLNNSLVQ